MKTILEIENITLKIFLGYDSGDKTSSTGGRSQSLKADDGGESGSYGGEEEEEEHEY